MNKPHHPAPASDGSPGKSIDELVEARLTPERLNNIWDRLQGVGNRDGQTFLNYGWADCLGDLWVTLKVTRVLHKLGAAGALAGAAVVLLLLLRPSYWVIQTPSGWPSAPGERLPETLRFRLGRSSATLATGLYALTGELRGTSRSGTDLTVIDVTFSGRTEARAPVTFRGSLILTNAPGVVNIHRREDFTGACLQGRLQVGTNAPVPISQPYASASLVPR